MHTLGIDAKTAKGLRILIEHGLVGDIKAALAALFRRSEFDDILLVVAPPGDRRGASRAWRLDGNEFVVARPERATDEWEVVCPFEGRDWIGELRLRCRLGRRALLFDLNFLFEVIQPALTNAASRISAGVLGFHEDSASQ